MTTEPTLQEKVKKVLQGYYEGCDDLDVGVNDIADILSATGSPAYCRVADDLRGVVLEEGHGYSPSEDGMWWTRDGARPGIEPLAFARYLGQFDKRGEGK